MKCWVTVTESKDASTAQLNPSYELTLLLILHCDLLSRWALSASSVKTGPEKLHGTRVPGLAGGAVTEFFGSAGCSCCTVHKYNCYCHDIRSIVLKVAYLNSECFAVLNKAQKWITSRTVQKSVRTLLSTSTRGSSRCLTLRCAVALVWATADSNNNYYFDL